MTKKWTNYIEIFSKDILEKLYVEEKLSKEQIAKELHICTNTVRNLLNYYEIERNNSEIISHSNTLHKGTFFRNLTLEISAEELYSRYITDNEPYEQLRQELGITGYMLDKLLDHYGIHKTRTQSSSIVLQSKLTKYGADNFNNWQKGHETRIANYGSLKASYDQGEKTRKATNLQRYGVECTFSIDDSDVARHKKHSKPNEHFLSYLKRYGIEDFEREFVIKAKSYDFKIDKHLIEINPSITHNTTFSPFGDHSGIDPRYHLNKSQLAESVGLTCIHVWDWDNLDKIVASLSGKNTLYARNCNIQELDTFQCNQFLQDYHLQNSCRGQAVRLGLFAGDELIQVMTFGKPRYNKKFEWELLRLCTKTGYMVVGGAQKLFKHFCSTYTPTSILSYCDKSKFSGDVYSKLGMQLSHTTKPTRHWYNLSSKQHFTDTFVRQHGVDQLLGTTYGRGTDNSEILRKHGFVEIYDCGQAIYTWYRKRGD